ncbi:MAG: branched-chain amino acid ABC transporter substrate-binding protein [Herbaspirillum sp.]
MTIRFRDLVVSLSVVAVFAAPNLMAKNIKIAMIETMSGSFAPIGQNQLHTFQLVMEHANKEQWAGSGNTFEITAFDGKGSPQESLTQLKTVIDQGYRYIAQGNGSGVASALIDAVNKHNARNPGKEVVFLNYAAIDPDLTNSKCSFWHFRFDANSDMKMEALTSYMTKDPSIKKIFLIDQNYSHGHQVSRAAKEYLKRKRPDIKIVGDDFHPIATVKDFSPYIAKIRASGADTVITGNWGYDLSLLIKAAKDAGVTARFYTYYAAGSNDIPIAIGSTGVGQVFSITHWNINNPTNSGVPFAMEFNKKYKDDFYAQDIYTIIKMVGQALKATKSVDPVKVAFALEGMKAKVLNGDVEMRKTDHQLQQPSLIVVWAKIDGETVKYDLGKTGYSWKTVQKIAPYIATQPTSCQMKHPSK